MRRLLALVLVLVGVACSSGSGSAPNSNPSGVAGFCDSACQKLAAQGCPNDDPQAACVAECKADLGEFGACSSQLQAWGNCLLSQPFHCGTDGKAELQNEPAAEAACTSQERAIEECSICLVDANTSDCGKCQRTTCCPQRKAARLHPDRDKFQECQNACTDSACYTACEQQYAGYLAADQAYDECVQASCPAC